VDFFAKQEQSRRTTRYLVVMFLLAFIAIALATTVVVAAAVRMYMENNTLFLGTESWSAWTAAHGSLLLGIAAGAISAMGLASFYRAATLSRGGGQVARMLGATEITGEGSDPLRRRLINVVEEMALASGLPVPEVFVLEEEPGINAFAAGLTQSDAAIAVTRGALERLDRAELQGVIAHEFSHILNGDMRLNQQLIGMSFGILVLSLAGRWLLRTARFGRRGRNSGGMTAALLLGLALTIIGAIGVLFSRLIKAAVSRQREVLADASAVQFTREPTGLAGALKKIGGYTGRLSSVDTEEVAHMLFERGSRAFSGLFATHPPLLDLHGGGLAQTGRIDARRCCLGSSALVGGSDRRPTRADPATRGANGIRAAGNCFA
jgi:Zn-dependent protease with chaperone function